MQKIKFRRGERDSIILALKAGVVPKRGLRYIRVDRDREIEELERDLERVAEGGTAIRFIVGDYGSGKTFFLNLIRLFAHEKNMVVLSADLTPDRRLHGTGGQARSLYAEMTRNISTRSKPEGGAMASIVERFANQAIRVAEKSSRQPGEVIRERLVQLEDLTSSYGFATVIARYWEGFETGNEELQTSALRWLRAEYTTLTDARKALGVRTIVGDANIYDQLKLLALFVRQAGYRGLLVSLDELVHLYKLPSPQARRSNHEQILRILNDVLQGTASHLGFILSGTQEFLTDARRGLYSYEALQSRLADNPFARDGLVDMSGPVIRLVNLTAEDMFNLLSNIRRVMQGENATLPDDALRVFMARCSNRIGDSYFRTPRNTVREFANMLSVLEQNPGVDWRTLVGTVDVAEDGGDDMSDIQDDETDDELASFKL